MSAEPRPPRVRRTFWTCIALVVAGIVAGLELGLPWWWALLVAPFGFALAVLAADLRLTMYHRRRGRLWREEARREW